MATTAYRRRRDGLVEIVRPSRRLRDLAIAAGITAAVLGFLAALAVALAFYLVLGVPLALAGLVFLAARLVRYRRSHREAPPAAPATLRQVKRIGHEHVRTMQPPGRARERGVRTAPPAGEGAVVIRIPGTAASRRE